MVWWLIYVLVYLPIVLAMRVVAFVLMAVIVGIQALARRNSRV